MLYHEWIIEAQRRTRKDKIRIPIIPASTYRDRDRKLQHSGILDWERFWLVAHRLDTPGMKAMLAERRQIYLAEEEAQTSVLEYRKKISSWYKRRGWTFNNGSLNPFDMLAYYRDKVNADVTPSPKQKVKPKDFIEARKKTEAKQIKKPSEKTHWLFKPQRMF